MENVDKGRFSATIFFICLDTALGVNMKAGNVLKAVFLPVEGKAPSGQCAEL